MTGTRSRRLPVGLRPETAYWVLIAGAFLTAVILRLPSVAQELPPFQFCDEAIYSAEAQRMVVQHGWRTVEFRSGGMNLYPMVLVGRLMEKFGLLNDTSFLVAGRLLYPVLLSSAAIWPVAAAARAITGRRLGGIVGAALFLLSPSLLAVSRYWYPDHYSSLFAALLVYLLVVLMLRAPHGRRRLLLWIAVGATLGAAVATKYTFSVGALPVVLAAATPLLTWRRESIGARLLRVAADLITAGIAALFVAVLLDFSAVLDPHGFMLGFQFNVQNYARPGGGPSGIGFYVFLLLVASLGLLGLIGLIKGLASTQRDRIPLLVVLLSFPLTTVLYLGLQGVVYNRNIVSSIPFLLPIIAAGLTALVSTRPSPRVLKLRPVVLGGLGLLAALQFAQVAANFAADLAPDSEPIAAAWIAKHVPHGTTVGTNPACSESAAQVAGLPTQPDTYLADGLQYYVINSYWESGLNKAYRGPAATTAILNQKYLHYYFPSDRDLPSDVLHLPWPTVTPQEAAPSGYHVIRVFDSNGPTIVVLRRDS